MFNINHGLYQEDLKNTSKYIDDLLSNNSSTSVLITGATGLVGSFLADALIYYNMNISNCIEIYVTSRNKDKLNERFGYYSSDQIHYIEYDMNEPIDSNVKYDYIFHFASNADPKSYELYPYETITTNVIGTYNIINYTKTHTNTIIVFTSTMEVYGESEKGDFSEEEYYALNFNNLRSGYPESKRISELMLKSAHKEYGIKSIIARLGYIYGPTMTPSDNKAVAQFIRSAVNKENVTLNSSGLQCRTYGYVADAVDAMLFLLKKEIYCESINVADEKSRATINDFANIVCRISKTKKIQLNNNISNNFFNTDLSLKKLSGMEWAAQTDLENGISKTIRILQNN